VKTRPQPSPSRSAASVRGAAARELALPPILGASAKMQRLLRLVQRVAPTDSTVLILGESGTGKELVARSLHLLSRRAQGPFVPVNVGALPESLVESELYGHARGAFTGAAAERQGLVEEADRGTLFLDEIGDMPLAAQVKLLRTLENNEVRRVGENAPRIVDVRVVAATNRDLHGLVAQGRFREDLFYRLNVVQLELPPLRERREDIGLLASFFLDRAARRQDRPAPAFAPDAMALLEKYDYPGNVRELENAIEHALAISEGPLLTSADLPTSIRTPRLLPRATDGPGAAPVRDGTRGREADRSRWSLEDVTREHVMLVLGRHHGNATAAARQLGLSRTTLWRMLKRWGVPRAGAQED